MLLSGFALSPQVLRAPITYDDYAAAFCLHADATPDSPAVFGD
jgi:hypothetical protein